jgi:hypothetical protein
MPRIASLQMIPQCTLPDIEGPCGNLFEVWGIQPVICEGTNKSGRRAVLNSPHPVTEIVLDLGDWALCRAPDRAGRERSVTFNSIQAGSFDDDVIRAMGAALELACKALPHPCHNEVVRDLIAKHIAEAASTGERDPAKLSERALHALSVDDMSMPVGNGRDPPGLVQVLAQV